MFKTLLASASVAVCCLLNPAGMPEAKAAASTCWFIPASGARVSGVNCNVSTRRNANGHVVHDIQHWNGNGARFSVVLWTDSGNADGAEVFIDGERFTTAWWRDADGDIRLDMGRSGTFVF